MEYYLFIFGSVTYAVSAQNFLAKHNITSTLKKIPASYSKTGCGYCLKINNPHKDSAIKLLESKNMSPKDIVKADS